MGLEPGMKAIAQQCAHNVAESNVPCCGMACDKGLWFPELPKSSLKQLKENIPKNCQEGYSSSRTCEIALSLHGQIPYQSIIHLVDDCTVPKK